VRIADCVHWAAVGLTPATAVSAEERLAGAFITCTGWLACIHPLCRFALCLCLCTWVALCTCISASCLTSAHIGLAALHEHALGSGKWLHFPRLVSSGAYHSYFCKVVWGFGSVACCTTKRLLCRSRWACCRQDSRDARGACMPCQRQAGTQFCTIYDTCESKLWHTECTGQICCRGLLLWYILGKGPAAQQITLRHTQLCCDAGQEVDIGDA
jgi:hypothetical protein